MHVRRPTHLAMYRDLVTHVALARHAVITYEREREREALSRLY